MFLKITQYTSIKISVKIKALKGIKNDEMTL